MREPTLSLPEIRVVEIPDEQFRAAERAADPEQLVVEPMEAKPAEPVEPAELPELDDYVEEEAEVEAAIDEEFEIDAEAESVSEPAPASQPAAAEPPAPILNTVRPIVDWPPEDQRKLVSLRLVARPPERLRGSLVRQALHAEGFVLGDFDIFHKPDAQNRAVLSAASLTKPGTFDLETMDSQRYVGLNLFAVLPGPRAPHKAFEELLLTARMLNERLEGAFQDERGGPLTPTRIQAIRDTLGHSETRRGAARFCRSKDRGAALEDRAQ